MSEQGWLKREMEIVQCEVATWPSWKRGEGMDDVKRYKLLQDVRYDDGAFVIPAGQVVIREADYDVLRDERDRLARAIVWALGYTDFRAREQGEGAYWWRTELRLRAKLTGEQIDAILAAMTPAGGGKNEK